jgi:hypothetical protein
MNQGGAAARNVSHRHRVTGACMDVEPNACSPISFQMRFRFLEAALPLYATSVLSAVPAG